MISDTVIVSLVVATSGLVSSIIGLKNQKAIRDVHVDINSRLSELIRASIDVGRVAERTDIASGVQRNPPKLKDLPKEPEK